MKVFVLVSASRANSRPEDQPTIAALLDFGRCLEVISDNGSPISVSPPPPLHPRLRGLLRPSPYKALVALFTLPNPSQPILHLEHPVFRIESYASFHSAPFPNGVEPCLTGP